MGVGVTALQGCVPGVCSGERNLVTDWSTVLSLCYKGCTSPVLGMDKQVVSGLRGATAGVSASALSSFNNGPSTTCCVSVLQAQSEERGQLAGHTAILL